MLKSLTSFASAVRGRAQILPRANGASLNDSSSSILRTRRSLPMHALMFSTLSLVGCDGGGLIEGDPVLPALDVFVIQTPAESRSSSSSQSSAVCATDTSAIDRIDAIVDEENAMSAADRALIEAALAATPEGDLVLATYEAEIEGRTLRIEVVSESSSGSVFTGTLVTDDGEVEVLSGTVTDDHASGTLVIEFPDAEKLTVAYDDGEDERRIVRKRGDHEAVLTLSDDDVQLVVNDTVAWWSKDAASGIVIDDGDIICFEGGESESDLCDTVCTPELTEKVTGAN